MLHDGIVTEREEQLQAELALMIRDRNGYADALKAANDEISRLRKKVGDQRRQLRGKEKRANAARAETAATQRLLLDRPEYADLKETAKQFGVSCWVELSDRVAELETEIARLEALINTPHIDDFLEAVRLEAAHQCERWGTEHDAGKADPDWYWLIGYLAGKALRPDQPLDKVLHHIITTAAVCLNWHAHKTGERTRMRPGIEGPNGNEEPTRQV